MTEHNLDALEQMARSEGLGLHYWERIRMNDGSHSMVEQRVPPGQLDSLFAELRSSRKVIGKYAWHEIGCSACTMVTDETVDEAHRDLAGYLKPSGLPCDCGYDAAMAELEELK